MPATSEKQRRFFGAVMGAKKGKPGSSGKAKEVAKSMPESSIKHFLHKASEHSLDPATQDYGTSIDDPGGSAKGIKNTPVGITGTSPKKTDLPRPPKGEPLHSSGELVQFLKDRVERNRSESQSESQVPVTRQKTQIMRGSDVGVKVAMDNTYIQGFQDKCASCGVNADVLVKQALGMPSMAGIGKAVGGVASKLKPMASRAGELLTGSKAKSLAEPLALNNNFGINGLPGAELRGEKLKVLLARLGLGGAVTGAGAGIGAAAQPKKPQGIAEHIKALMAQMGVQR